MAIDILEHCKVSPSMGAATEQLLPLLHSDILFLDSPLTSTLFFYNLHCSESHFLSTIVPSLKSSLSLALKHFLPLAGRIVFPLSSGLPVSHYVAGDSVSLTIALSDADFMHLTGNHCRDADKFHDFVAQMPSNTYSSDLIKLPVAAIQVTLFPNRGICIGLTTHHAIGDGATLVAWLQAWASINKFNDDAHLVALGEKFLPSYDRSTIRDASKLATICWDHMKLFWPTVSSTISLPTYKVRQTFVLTEAEIQKLKQFVLNKKPDTARVSSYVVVCAHVWSCLVKSTAAIGEEVADNVSEYLFCAADYRSRLSPPLPDTYFGNCLALVLAESTHGTLNGNEGFLAAAQAIKEAINNDKGMNWLKEKKELFEKRVWVLAGSPTFDLYSLDYGWGRLTKFESVAIDDGISVFLCKSSGGGVEIGLSMPEVKMDAFAAFFYHGLTEATESNESTKLSFCKHPAYMKSKL